MAVDFLIIPAPKALFASIDPLPARSLYCLLTDPGLRQWFSRLSEGGQVVDDLQTRPWGDSDGQVIDRYGLHWLIGFEGSGGD